MKPTYTEDNALPGSPAQVPWARTAVDLALVLLLAVAVIVIAAGAPTNLYAYAQLRRAGTAVSMLETGNWVLPVNQTTEIASKPQLYAWLTALSIRLTGTYDDWVFRLPTVAATLIAAAMVYFLARRWYGRRVGLLAGCLWATCLHMNRMAYLAATDMVLTASVTGAILCADRLLYHRAARGEQWKWAVGLWVCMVLGALSKGWGLVNFALVGLALALASGVGPGFAACQARKGLRAKTGLVVRLLARRLWRTARATRLGWGLLAMAAILAPLWVAMFAYGGRELASLVYFDLFQRATGAGEHAPDAASAPAVLYLLYYGLPMSVFAVGAVVLTVGRRAADTSRLPRRLARLFTRRSPLSLPVCWTVAVVLPFSLAHGFRPDYLLPCYAPVAMLAAWAVERVMRARETPTRSERTLRHAIAGVCIACCLALPAIVVWLWQRPPESFAVRTSSGPAFLPAGGLVALSLPVVGVVGAALAVRQSLRWRIRSVVACGIVGMLGVAYLHTHALSRHARSGDGETMREFAESAAAILGRGDGCEPFAVYRTNKLSVEPYLGRLGVRLVVREPRRGGDANAPGDLGRLSDGRQLALEALPGRSLPNRVRWLITCDFGLSALGAYREDLNGPYKIRILMGQGEGGRKHKLRVRPLPGLLGTPRLTSRAVATQNRGRLHLIERKPDVRITGRPLVPAWESSKRERY